MTSRFPNPYCWMLLAGWTLLATAGTSAQPEPSAEQPAPAATEALASAPAWQPTPFRAEYQVRRNGKPLARAEMQLEQVSEQHYHITSKAEGSRGLARLVGFRDEQEARFAWPAEALPRPQSSSNYFKAAWRDSEWQASYDWQAGRVSGEGDDGPFDLPLSKGTQDPATVNWAILQGVAAGEREFRLQVVDKDQVEEQHFLVRELPLQGQPDNCSSVLLIERQRDNSSRFTASWHLPELDYAMVRLDHGKRGGDHFSKTVTALWQGGREVALPQACLEAVEQSAAPAVEKWLAEP